MNTQPNTLRSIILVIAIAGGSTWSSLAQEEKIDLEARKRSIPIIEERISVRTSQIAEIGSEILQLHKRMDEKLSRMVDRLAAVKDSVRSAHSVGKVKMEVIDGLQKAVEAFQSRRLALERGLLEGKSGIPPEVIKNEIGHFDHHVEMHIEQMLNISKSFTQDENVKRYESRVEGGSYGSGWSRPLIKVSDKWRQNQKDRAMDKKQREDVITALKKSIAGCEARIKDLRKNLEDKSLSEIDRGVIQSDLDSHLSMLQTRQSQVEELLVVEKPNTTEISRDAAAELEEAVADLMGDIQRDLQTIILKHAQLSGEQSKLFKLQENLEARKKWLEEYEKTEAK
jgi:hypothetical protein